MLEFYLSIVNSESDKKKVEYIYENYYSFMCYAAGCILKHNKFDVEDTVHNAMMKIIENIDIIDISDKRKVKNLCGIIARNKAIDHLRRKDNQMIPLDDSIVNDETDETSPEKIIISKETFEKVLNAVESLDEKYRDVCILKYVHQLKDKEIGLLLDLNEKTVSTRIYRGKQMVKEALRKEGLHD